MTTHFVTVADAMKKQYLQAHIGRPDQFTRIFSGFALEPFLQARNDVLLRDQFGLKPDDIIVGKIGRLVPLKGHDDLFEVARELVDACPRIKFLRSADRLNHRLDFSFQVVALVHHVRDVRSGSLLPLEHVNLMKNTEYLVRID